MLLMNSTTGDVKRQHNRTSTELSPAWLSHSVS